MAAADSGDSSPPSSASNASPFDPNQLLEDFNKRLRARYKPLDLSISQETLSANNALFLGYQLPPTPSVAAARAAKRWKLDDVVDVEDISGRAAPCALPAPGLAREPLDEVLPTLAESAAALAVPKQRSREHLPWVEELDLAAERAEAARREQQAQALAQALLDASAAELKRMLQQQIAQAQAQLLAEVQVLSQQAWEAYKKAQALSRRRATLAAKKLINDAEALRAAQAVQDAALAAGRPAAQQAVEVQSWRQEQEVEAALARESVRLAREAQAERERAELAAFLHIDLKVSEANAGSADFDLGQIKLPELSPAQARADTQKLDLHALGDLGQMLAKVAQSSRQVDPEAKALDLHGVAEAAQLGRTATKT